ncbi:hypothetical protein ATCCBAA256_25340 [Mycobacterium montefiorense]|nr:hypothetical protein ATCCBAA256_25340 [Mycobacterium montefiorense]
MAMAGLIATVSAALPRKPAALAVLWCRTVRSSVAIDISIVEHVVGMPLRGQRQRIVPDDVVGAARLVLQGVDGRDDGTVEPLVVGMRGRCR